MTKTIRPTPVEYRSEFFGDFDDAWDALERYVAEMRAEHPQHRVTDCKVFAFHSALRQDKPYQAILDFEDLSGRAVSVTASDIRGAA